MRRKHSTDGKIKEIEVISRIVYRPPEIPNEEARIVSSPTTVAAAITPAPSPASQNGDRGSDLPMEHPGAPSPSASELRDTWDRVKQASAGGSGTVTTSSPPSPVLVVSGFIEAPRPYSRQPPAVSIDLAITVSYALPLGRILPPKAKKLPV